jgi:hypothetical protein
VTLDELRNAGPGIYGLTDVLDPVTRAPYDYAISDSTHYSLCAAFASEDSLGPGGMVDASWRHPAGRHCFAFRVPRALPALR